LAVTGAVRDAQGLLVTWFLGTQTGTAIAEVLFGDYNPSGVFESNMEELGGSVFFDPHTLFF